MASPRRLSLQILCTHPKQDHPDGEDREQPEKIQDPAAQHERGFEVFARVQDPRFEDDAKGDHHETKQGHGEGSSPVPSPHPRPRGLDADQANDEQQWGDGKQPEEVKRLPSEDGGVPGQLGAAVSEGMTNGSEDPQYAPKDRRHATPAGCACLQHRVPLFDTGQPLALW